MNRIKEFRTQKSWSIYDLAKEAKLTPGYIASLERGDRKNPSKEAMERIAKSLGRTVQEVFFPDEEVKKING